ncbi:MAG: hypothetical protein OHK0029_28870 [Armatimonadaceae bacterium]
MPAVSAHRLESDLLHPDLEHTWYDNLASFGGSHKEYWEECLRFIRQCRDELVQSLRDIGDKEEQQSLINLSFVRFRCHWSALNTQIGYQLANNREQPDTILKACLVADLCGRIEPYVSDSFQKRVQQIVENPVSGRPANEPETGNVDPLGFRQRNELEKLRAGMRLLEESIGARDVADVLQLLRRLQDELLEVRTALAEAQSNLDGYRSDFGAMSHREVVQMMRALSQEVADLQQELVRTRTTQIQLERELGVTNTEDALASIYLLRARANEYKAECDRMRLFVEGVGRELGTQDVRKAISIIRMLKDRSADLVARLAQYEADLTVLQEEIGTTNFCEVIQIVQQARSAGGLSDVVSHMEDALDSLYSLDENRPESSRQDSR